MRFELCIPALSQWECVKEKIENTLQKAISPSKNTIQSPIQFYTFWEVKHQGVSSFDFSKYGVKNGFRQLGLHFTSLLLLI